MFVRFGDAVAGVGSIFVLEVVHGSLAKPTPVAHLGLNRVAGVENIKLVIDYLRS